MVDATGHPSDAPQIIYETLNTILIQRIHGGRDRTSIRRSPFQ